MSRYTGRLPTTYAEAEAYLRGGHVRTVVNNTRISRQDEETIAVQFHGNTIATFRADGSRTYTTTGYATKSTHQRLNGMTPLGYRFRSHLVDERTAPDTWEAHPADTLHLTAENIPTFTEEH